MLFSADFPLYPIVSMAFFRLPDAEDAASAWKSRYCDDCKGYIGRGFLALVGFGRERN